MANLIKSDEEQAAKAEPREAARYTNSGDSHWPLHSLLVLIAVGLIVGLVFLARWIYHETKHTTSGNKPATSQSQTKKTSQTAGQKPGTQKSSNSQTLPNNGPGNVVGVFVAATFVAGALHYVISLRRAARED